VAEKLIIIGAGDHGRGTLEIVKARNAQAGSPEFDVIGFLDDDPAATGRSVDGWPVLGPTTWISEHHQDEFRYVFGIANCSAKKTLDAELEDMRPRFATLVHPTAVLGSDVRLDEGCIVAAGAVIAYETVIGRHVTINLNATVGHDCVVGNYCTIAPGVNIAGRVTIGQGCDLSLNATVIRGITIGAWSSLGPGAVALKDIPPSEFWFGNAARPFPSFGSRAV
jgi:sugar O-acyltransferase (sialic acid O-acetyltransferase NeuD family)